MTEAEMLLASRPCQADWYSEDPLSRAKKTRLRSLLQQYSLWLSIGSDLLHHRELVPIVPAFHDLAVANANHRHSCDSGRLAAPRNAQMVSLARHRGGPTNHYFVPRPKGILNLDVYIRKCSTNALNKGTKSAGPRTLTSGSPWPIPMASSASSSRTVSAFPWFHTSSNHRRIN